MQLSEDFRLMDREDLIHAGLQKTPKFSFRYDILLFCNFHIALLSPAITVMHLLKIKAEQRSSD